MLKTRVGFVISLLLIVLALSPVLAQDDPTVITVYNNTGTLQFDSGGSNPEVLAEIQDYIISETGIRLDVIVPPGGTAAQEKLNLLLGSSDPLDTFQAARWTDYRDVIIPLNDLLDEYAQDIRAAIPESEWRKCTDPEGNIMCIPRTSPASPYITWVRGDWLEELGLEVPTTVEELETVMAAFQEMNPDAVIGTRPADYAKATVGGWTEYGYSNWPDPDDGNRIKPWVLQDGVQDWVAKMNEWWNNGWFFADTFTSFEEPELFRTCNVGIWSGWYSRITLIVPQVQDGCPGMEYIRTSITGPEGYLATVNQQPTSGYVVTKKSQNPDAVVRYINWLYADVENDITARYGIKDKHWWWVDEENKIVDRDQESGYVSEFTLPHPIIETRYSILDPARAWHLEYLGGQYYDLSDAKMPFDAELAWDETRIADEVPGLGDINRLIEEQLILFITGARPLDQWDAFIEDLYRAGMDEYIDALTTQYAEITGM
ncbi:MAG: ABC transporter substrate-binding protein [Anaerolineaceae bacterium]|nr:ABC transporter substrate-binding protein [Anaerolineaceae bacterium]